MFSKKATIIDLLSKCQIVGEDFVNFCGLLRKWELLHRNGFWTKCQLMDEKT